MRWKPLAISALIVGVVALVIIATLVVCFSEHKEPEDKNRVYVRNGHCEVKTIAGKEYIVCSNLRGVAVCPR